MNKKKSFIKSFPVQEHLLQQWILLGPAELDEDLLEQPDQRDDHEVPKPSNVFFFGA
jgi:hypothetical protein